jgi:hypothetical protein
MLRWFVLRDWNGISLSLNILCATSPASGEAQWSQFYTGYETPFRDIIVMQKIQTCFA